MTGDPYADATRQNTDTTWLDDAKPVDVDLDSMVDYAKAMVTADNNLKTHQGRVFDQMNSLVSDAFAGGFPEIGVIASTHRTNLSEFGRYIGFLYAGVNNVAMAAQTIADAYGNTDGWSAASLDAVKFAFGDPDAHRPAGLPPMIGKQGTYYDQLAKQEEQAAQGGGPDSAHSWHVESTSKYGDTETTIYEDQYGNTRTVTVVHDGDDKTVYTTGPDGTTHVTTYDVTSFGYPGGASTTTQVTVDGRETRHQTESTYSTGHGGIDDTTQYDNTGRPTSSTEVSTAVDGTQTTTGYSYDKDGDQHKTSQVTVGDETDGVGRHVDSPAADALNDLKQQMG